MFKACDYCRHRKKKCVVAHPSGKCSDCQHLGLACEFSQRVPSAKRRQTSKKIADRVRTAASWSSTDEDHGAPDSGIDAANLKEGDCQLRLAGKHDMANKRLFQPRDPADAQRDLLMSTSEKYWRDVHPFWPFIGSEMLDVAEMGGDPDFKHCIDMACLLSLNTTNDLKDIPLHIDRLVSILQRGQLPISLVAGTLLLSPFMNLDNSLLDKIFDTVAYELANATVSIQQPVLASALLTNSWRRLAGHPHKPLHLPVSVLDNYAQALDADTFGHHFMRLSRHATELDQRCMMLDAEGIQPDTALVWSKLEYECLLWQVCLPPWMLDTRDDLPATPESVVVHCYSSMLLLSLYSYVLEHADTLGRLIALRPVPGVLLFTCILARSTFICPRDLLDRMPLLVDMQAQTARIMLKLWHQTGFENCRGILNLFEDPEDRFPQLTRKIREEIGLGPWVIEEVDGYSVFWTFRDLRTLTTKFIFGDHL